MKLREKATKTLNKAMTGTRKQRGKKDEVRTFVRSSKCSLKFLNANRSDAVRELHEEYVRILRLAIDAI